MKRGEKIIEIGIFSLVFFSFCGECAAWESAGGEGGDLARFVAARARPLAPPPAPPLPVPRRRRRRFRSVPLRSVPLRPPRSPPALRGPHRARSAALFPPSPRGAAAAGEGGRDPGRERCGERGAGGGRGMRGNGGGGKGGEGKLGGCVGVV